ncbi:MAG: hypothetical protein LBC81_00565 [Tannerellaceae bacterium]|nr:hypothetical protein [Tannerellaceae bacterium]
MAFKRLGCANIVFLPDNVALRLLRPGLRTGVSHQTCGKTGYRNGEFS